MIRSEYIGQGEYVELIAELHWMRTPKMYLYRHQATRIVSMSLRCHGVLRRSRKVHNTDIAFEEKVYLQLKEVCLVQPGGQVVRFVLL